MLKGQLEAKNRKKGKIKQQQGNGTEEEARQSAKFSRMQVQQSLGKKQEAKAGH